MITQKKVAEHVGMSTKTVANILGGQDGYRYSDKTRKQVLEAAKELGYQENRISRAIKRGRSNLIGVINLGSFSEISQRVQAKLPSFINEEGYDYLSIDLNWHGGDIERVIAEVIQARVEGVIISHMVEAFGPQYTAILAKADIPAVTLYGNGKLNIPLIADDARAAYFAMTSHLLALKNQRVMLFVGDEDASRPARLRREGFAAALQGFAPVQAISSKDLTGSRIPWTASAEGIILGMAAHSITEDITITGYRAAKRVLAMDDIPDAIVCFNDRVAFGVFTAAFEAGLRIPEDLAVTGGDNDLFGEFPLYGLSTVEKDLDGATATSVKTLLSKIRKEKNVPERQFFSSTLVFRKSCGRTIAPDGAATELIPVSPIPNTQLNPSLTSIL
ncbi:MAG: LacI family DNA-binding transcriptional regulator [Chthoniobacterales bacterium]